MEHKITGMDIGGGVINLTQPHLRLFLTFYGMEFRTVRFGVRFGDPLIAVYGLCESSVESLYSCTPVPSSV